MLFILHRRVIIRLFCDDVGVELKGDDAFTQEGEEWPRSYCFASDQREKAKVAGQSSGLHHQRQIHQSVCVVTIL